MSNIKISQLPNWIGGNTTGSFIVMNDSGSNTTYKIRKEQWLFPYSGNATISGSLNVTNTITAATSSVGRSITTGDSLIAGNLFAQTGYVNTPFILAQSSAGPTGTLDIYTFTRLSVTSSIGDVNISAGESGATPKNILLSSRGGTINSGSLTVTGSVNISSVMTLAKQNPLPTGTTGSLAVSGSGLYFHNGTSWNLIS